MPSLLPALRKSALCLVLFSITACGGTSCTRGFTPPSVLLSYDDLGTAASLQPILGPRGTNPQVRVHHGATRPDAHPRLLNAHQALAMLRRNEHALPQTAENAQLRQRMGVAYSHVYDLYRTRRDAMQAVPPFTGRGAMNRMQMLPPMPPTL